MRKEGGKFTSPASAPQLLVTKNRGTALALRVSIVRVFLLIVLFLDADVFHLQTVCLGE
jgi:hypothetical protein